MGKVEGFDVATPPYGARLTLRKGFRKCYTECLTNGVFGILYGFVFCHFVPHMWFEFICLNLISAKWTWCYRPYATFYNKDIKKHICIHSTMQSENLTSVTGHTIGTQIIRTRAFPLHPVLFLRFFRRRGLKISPKIFFWRRWIRLGEISRFFFCFIPTIKPLKQRQEIYLLEQAFFPHPLYTNRSTLTADSLFLKHCTNLQF